MPATNTTAKITIAPAMKASHRDRAECKRRLYIFGRRRSERQVDYAYARRRARLSSLGSGAEHKYDFSALIDLARRKSEDPSLLLRLQTEQLRPEFTVLAEQWRRDTRHLSLISKKLTHQSYFRITGMGRPVIPLLLEELRERPAHWFAALRATANADPAETATNPSQARDAWLEWGTAQGYID
jgi:hypothetical protein